MSDAVTAIGIMSEQKIGNKGDFVHTAGTRISCKLSDSTTGAQTCKVKFIGHLYG